MAAKHRIQTPRVTNIQAHLYIACGDVVCGLRPPCFTACPRLPQVATAKFPSNGPSTLSVEVAHNAMPVQTQSNTGTPSWPSTI